MSQQSVRQAARRSALNAQAARRRDRERRLEALAVAVLTALGERDRAVKDAEMRAGEALRAMSVDEGLHETYATTLAVGSDIGGEEGLAVDHTTSATWQPDRRWRPGRRGRAAGSASTQYCGA